MRNILSFLCFFFISSAVIAQTSVTQRIFKSCASKPTEVERLECYEGIILNTSEEKSDYNQSAKAQLQWCSSKIEIGERVKCYDKIAEEALRQPFKEVKNKATSENSSLVPLFQDYEKQALRGDYGAQRNVAFCLSTPEECKGKFTANKIDACMWRMIILSSGHKETDSSDIMRYHIDCKSPKLSNQERYLAITKAESMFIKIYKRQMPLEPLQQ